MDLILHHTIHLTLAIRWWYSRLSILHRRWVDTTKDIIIERPKGIRKYILLLILVPYSTRQAAQKQAATAEKWSQNKQANC